MFNSIAAASGLSLLFAAVAPARLAAQDSARVRGPAASQHASTDSATVRFARYRRYPWNGVNVWAGNAYETRSAAHNEHMAGSMRILGIQISRDIWRGQRGKLLYLGEVLPVMLARSGPPTQRIPDTLRNHYSEAELNRFKYRDAYGFGLAPFGLEASYQTSKTSSALFNITAGGLLFSKIVPYGNGTQPNFTVSPGVALQWEPAHQMRMAVGYTFHHLSNASFGKANPGMNSQLLYVRFSRLRKQPTP
ncbi:MAG: acyloxyacyl hydrolase [Gemmatimonas sp.]